MLHRHLVVRAVRSARAGVAAPVATRRRHVRRGQSQQRKQRTDPETVARIDELIGATLKTTYTFVDAHIDTQTQTQLTRQTIGTVCCVSAGVGGCACTAGTFHWQLSTQRPLFESLQMQQVHAVH